MGDVKRPLGDGDKGMYAWAGGRWRVWTEGETWEEADAPWWWVDEGDPDGD